MAASQLGYKGLGDTHFISQFFSIPTITSDVFRQSHLINPYKTHGANFSTCESEKQACAKVTFANISNMESIRVKNLRSIIATDYENSQKAFSVRTGISLSQLGQWLGGYRNIGEKAARKIENTCKKQTGWLDQSPRPPHQATMASQNAAESSGDYVVTKKHTKQIQSVIEIMEALDERGQTKIQFLVEDEAQRHKKLIADANATQPDAAALLLVELFKNGNEVQRRLISTSLEAAIAKSDNLIKKAS